MTITTFDPSSSDTETAAVAEIRALTPLCFQNLLSRTCDVAIDDCAPEDRTGVSIDPLIGSINRRKHLDGVQFSMHGRLKTGTPRQFDVIVHGLHKDDGVEFFSIEKAMNGQGKPGPRFFEQTGTLAA